MANHLHAKLNHIPSQLRIPFDSTKSSGALMRMDRINWLARVNQKLATMSWKQTWEDMHAAIEETAHYGKEPQAVQLNLAQKVLSSKAGSKVF
jgi:hypothetical protein